LTADLQTEGLAGIDKLVSRIESMDKREKYNSVYYILDYVILLNF
jgi:hypothetical protein